MRDWGIVSVAILTFTIPPPLMWSPVYVPLRSAISVCHWQTSPFTQGRLYGTSFRAVPYNIQTIKLPSDLFSLGFNFIRKTNALKTVFLFPVLIRRHIIFFFKQSVKICNVIKSTFGCNFCYWKFCAFKQQRCMIQTLFVKVFFYCLSCMFYK